MSAARRHVWLPSLLIGTGGALLAAGSIAPWLEFYGGLHTYSGVTGWWGRLLLIAGLVAIALALWPVATRRPVVGLMVTALGIGAGALAATRLQHAVTLVNSGDAVMLVPSLGPGLLLVLAGSLVLTCAGAWVVATRPRRHDPRRDGARHPMGSPLPG